MKNPFTIKPKSIYNDISKELSLKCLQYKSLSTSILREINKKMPEEIKSFEDIPNDREYFKALDNKSFFLYKDEKMIIFQSKFQALLYL